MIEKPLDDLSFADIESLIAGQRTEDRRIEFKRELTGGSDSAKKEYLADLSSLANAQGGDLVFGIEDTGGVASDALGVSPADADAEILRLENLARDGLQPRLIGLRSKFIPSSPGSSTGILVQRVPASLNAPHRIIFQNSGRFFTRHSRGKAEMDVVELREAFTASEGVMPRLRLLHGQLNSLTHITQHSGPQVILTIAPLSIARRQEMLEFSSYEDAVLPPFSGGVDWGHTLEGFLSWRPTRDGGAYDQVLTHRAGYVEAVSSQASSHSSDNSWLWIAQIAKFVRGVATDAIKKLGKQGVVGPWVLLVSLEGVRGFELNTGEVWISSRTSTRNRYDFREIIFDDFSVEVLVPLFRQIWWAFGLERPHGRNPEEG